VSATSAAARTQIRRLIRDNLAKAMQHGIDNAAVPEMLVVLGRDNATEDEVAFAGYELRAIIDWLKE